MLTLKNTIERPVPELPSVTWLWVTREVALELLSTNTHNRRRKKRQLDRMIEAMNGGYFMITTDCIGLYEDGALANGQHRLESVVITGKPQWFLVIFEMNRETRRALDRIARRTNSDDLTIDGLENANTLAAAVTWLWQWKLSRFDRATCAPNSIEAERLLRQHPSLPKSVTVGRRMRGVMPAGPASFAHCHATLAGVHEVDAFFSILETGLGFGDLSDPIYRLRTRLLRQRKEKSNLRSLDCLALCLKALRLYDEGKSCKTLAWRKDEDFPVLCKYRPEVFVP